MISQRFDDRGLIANLNDAEKRRLPTAVLIALNDSAFTVRAKWGSETLNVFDRPTSLTQRGALVRKATSANLQAEVYIRDDATKGTPPSRYLQSQVRGGPREQKPFENRMQAIPQARKFYIPGKGMTSQLDRYGNVPARLISKILSQLGTRRDPTQNETAVSRARRLRKQGKKGGGGSYFMLNQRRGKLRPGVVYERIKTAQGSAVRSVLIGTDNAPTYRKRYDVFALAQRMFDVEFGRRFSRALRGLRTR